MNELGREPVELIEILLPKCANTSGVAPCGATATGDAKCFNTRATCTSTSDFQARPLNHLTPDIVLAQGDTGSTDFNGLDSYMVEVNIQFPLEPDGCVFEVGGSGTGAYIGFTEGSLVSRCGDGSSLSPPAAARLVVDPAPYLGGSYKLIARWTYQTGVSCTTEMWLFDPVELELYSLGSITSASDPGNLFDSGGYGVGTISAAGNLPVGESDADYNSKIDSAFMYFDQEAILFPEQNAYRQRYFFDDGRAAKPSDDLYIFSGLSDVSTVGSRLNIAGADRRYEALGRRAYMNLEIADFNHTDFTVDPYLVDRTYDPLDRGTFWPRFLQRNKFGKTRALVRRYSGYAGDLLADMRRQTYVLDRIDNSNFGVRIQCRDFLALTEFSKAQIPAPSSGKLDLDMDLTQTSMFLTGDVTDEYPPAGTVRVDEELITYTARAYDAGDDQTDFTGLTRGTDGSLAVEHDIDEVVQVCRRYTNDPAGDVYVGMLVDDARIPAQLVNIAKIDSEYNQFLTAYSVTTLISEPTGVDQLIGELAEQCTFYTWWNERDQIIDFKAIRPLSESLATLSNESGIIGDSFQLSERPEERISTITISYRPRNFAGDLNKPTNYQNAVVISNSAGNAIDQYGKLPQIREIFSRWLVNAPQVNQTGSRLSIRFEEVPRYASCLIDAKDAELWVGDFIKFSHPLLSNARGVRDQGRRWVVVEAEEVVAGHSQKIHAVDITLDGQTYFITENGIGTYTSELFADGNAFITDNDGLNPDGSTGATIG